MPDVQNRFHLSLNVTDLAKSVAFFRQLFGQEPAKQRADYAKFELADPPVVLSLEPHPPQPGGALNHVGFRLPDAATLVEWQRRLELAGIRTQREEGVECCYARQTKFWVRDPDRNLWEFYVLQQDIDHRGAGQVPDQMVPQQTPPVAVTLSPQQAVWEHLLSQTISLPLPFENGTLDEVRLRGTFNVKLSRETRQQLLREIRRTLRPDGQLFVHVLTADRPLLSAPSLPGPAAYVQAVPVDRDLLDEVQQAGFVDLQLTKLAASPCFQAEGVEMRETKLTARKAGASNGSSQRTVLYKGPFRELRDDEGRVYRRGERVTVSAEVAERLTQEEFADQFVCFSAPNPNAVACGTSLTV